MTTVAEALAQAAHWDGYVEEPPGSNNTEFGRWYGVNPDYWCAMYVSRVFFDAGLPLPASTSKGFAYTPQGAKWFMDNQRFVGPSAPIAPGMVVFYYYPSKKRIAHVGIVADVIDSQHFHAWEGNTDAAGGRTGGRVIKQTRSRSTVGAHGGFGIPALSDLVYPPADQQEPTPATAPPYPGRVLKLTNPMMRGEDVKNWQGRMAQIGYRISSDGVYGRGSEGVCKEFQRMKGLGADGQVGPKTWKASWA